MPAENNWMDKKDEENTEKTMRVLTYNAGLLRFHLFGLFQVFSNPPYAQERLPYIVAAIREQKPDIVCLQEVYEKTHLKFISERLADILPHVGRAPGGGSGSFKYHNGLVCLSRWPITSAAFVKYRQAATLEKVLANKGQLVVNVAVPGMPNGMRVVNLHTTAGGTANPEDAGTDDTRQDEILQGFESASDALGKGTPTVLCGDLNAGPEASVGNYESVLKRGYRDCWVEAADAGLLETGGFPPFSWNNENPLNAVGPHKDCSPQRCDHLFLPKASEWQAAHMDDWKVSQAKLCMTEKVVDIKGTYFTPSDHYGVCFSLTC
mmetsp:Transcript_15740/g.31071  ORF Transcript_15740/g.31071 Transcript_15740/m.31071 type:complete len:321 (-) Transcript_15740:335-1297(-)